MIRVFDVNKLLENRKHLFAELTLSAARVLVDGDGVFVEEERLGLRVDASQVDRHDEW